MLRQLLLVVTDSYNNVLRQRRVAEADDILIGVNGLILGWIRFLRTWHTFYQRPVVMLDRIFVWLKIAIN